MFNRFRNYDVKSLNPNADIFLLVKVVIMCTFERKLDSKVFCVATTHLKARVGALLPTLRNEQGKDLLQFVQSHNTNDYPVIYAGDFNAEPTEPVYRHVA